jgi:hypothetical protein
MLAGCGSDARVRQQEYHESESNNSSAPSGLDSAVVERLTEKIESENFVFHYEPGDSVWVDRQEALHRWAVDFLEISLPKKIDYYKLSFDAMHAAVGIGASGTGYPADYALASIYSWHPHETMHIYTYSICQHATIRFYDEGMSVAHEVDPLNNDWVARWQRWRGDGGYVYAEKVREHRAEGRLHRIAGILESHTFDLMRSLERGTVNNRVIYDQAGMFVSYLIDTFGIDKMKQAICSVARDDDLDTILSAFQAAFGLSVQQAEKAWWAYLDATAPR